jgi:putative protease
MKKPIKKPVKKVAKKTVKKATKKTTKKEKLVGKIIHYYDHIGVGIVKITKEPLKVGQKIHIKGTTTDFEQDIKSMQIEHEQIKEAKKGKIIGLKIKETVREGDLVYKG